MGLCGTSLRLCYGSERFSEELYFAGGKNFSARSMAAVNDCIAGKIGKRFDLDMTVREPSGEGFRAQMERLLPQTQHDKVFGKAGYEKYFENTVSGLLYSLQKELEFDAQKIPRVPLGKKKCGPEL
ncbi:hypothetical protein AFERRID_07400 [Acidithiobacillus ferridurans]|uniref:Uncharacterized protein n=2 Tax=Acidithiobacillus ferridurans TaxID=1232575 RepID=A0A2Z6IG15_ACIFI|nr:hypothetical protein AFERRID_07400 [Acidithiobacillus ferridurans]